MLGRCLAPVLLVAPFALAAGVLADEVGDELYQSGHYERALESWEKAAAAGDVQAAYRLGAADHRDEIAFVQGADGTAAVDPPDIIDLQAGDRLAIGDDGQDFQTGFRKAGETPGLEHLLDDGREFRLGGDLPAASELDHGEGVSRLFVFRLQCLHRILEFRGFHLGKYLLQPGHGQGAVGGEEQGFEFPFQDSFSNSFGGSSDMFSPE